MTQDMMHCPCMGVASYDLQTCPPVTVISNVPFSFFQTHATLTITFTFNGVLSGFGIISQLN